MRVPVDFGDARALRAAFSYMTRIGAAPAFGTRPVGWYQIHQCHALAVLAELLGGPGQVRTRAGVVEGRRDGARGWRRLSTPAAVWRDADGRARR